MVHNADTSYAGTELLAVGEQALANYNAWIVRQFVRYFRNGNAAGTAVLDFGAGIGTLSVIFERDSGVRPLAIEVDVDQQATLRQRNIETYASLADLPRPMDFIYSSNVLEHIADDAAILAALRDRLVVGGKIGDLRAGIREHLDHARRSGGTSSQVHHCQPRSEAGGGRLRSRIDQVLRLPGLPARVPLQIHWRRFRRA